MQMKYNVSREGIPITTRQLEAMIRMAQARAKANLRSHVTKEDAEDIKDLMGLSIIQTLSDGNGNIESSRKGANGTSKVCTRKGGATNERRAKRAQEKVFLAPRVVACEYGSVKRPTRP